MHWKWHILWCSQGPTENDCSREAGPGDQLSTCKRCSLALLLRRCCSWWPNVYTSSENNNRGSNGRSHSTPIYPTLGFQDCPVNMHFLAGKGKKDFTSYSAKEKMEPANSEFASGRFLLSINHNFAVRLEHHTFQSSYQIMGLVPGQIKQWVCWNQHHTVLSWFQVFKKLKFFSQLKITIMC